MEVGHGTAPPGLQEGQGHIAAPHTAWAGTWAGERREEARGRVGPSVPAQVWLHSAPGLTPPGPCPPPLYP